MSAKDWAITLGLFGFVAWLFVVLPAYYGSSGTEGLSRAESTMIFWTGLAAIAASVSAVVAAVQAVFFFKQLRYMRAGMAHTQSAAEAAGAGARAAAEATKLAVISQRPILVFEFALKGLRSADDGEPRDVCEGTIPLFATVDLRVKNVGEMPAIIGRVSMKFCVSDALPLEPHYDPSVVVTPPRTMLVRDRLGPPLTPANFLIEISVEQQRKILNGEEFLWLWGKLEFATFQDSPNAVFSYRFARKYLVRRTSPREQLGFVHDEVGIPSGYHEPVWAND